jgi:hypothetical protein
MPDFDHNNVSPQQEGAHHARSRYALESLQTLTFHAQFPLGEGVSFWLPVLGACGYKGAAKTRRNGPVENIG